jgi:heme oxygenase
VVLYLKGAIERESYIRLLTDYYFIYTALEDGLQYNRDNKAVIDIDDSALYRTKAISKDLKYFLGEDWYDIITPSPSASVYVDRINFISRNNPELLVAHHYTRYLGDLSGGQILKNITKTALKLPEKALNFYIFTRISNPAEYKVGYRDRLDRLPLTQNDEDVFIRECNRSFKMSSDVMSEMSQSNLVTTIKRLVGRLLTNPY